jgi:hypothetical protein
MLTLIEVPKTTLCLIPRRRYLLALDLSRETLQAMASSPPTDNGSSTRPMAQVEEGLLQAQLAEWTDVSKSSISSQEDVLQFRY